MASSITLQSTLLRSNFLGQNNCFNHPHKPYSLIPKDHRLKLKPCAKLDLFEILGGRGLCNGEKGVQQELERNIEEQASSTAGGFPGGEKGLKRFVEENPPPKKQSVPKLTITSRPKPPELPLLLPGMIAIVKNPNNPFYMYTGIVQRITDGKAGVIFEGGNWDKLVSFRLEELERREKGPPGKNPSSSLDRAINSIL
ncbi:NAD(P)H-quinone oxidoreductase subunit S [Populus alba x Populus x berolinensis]|nr:NAD(P)H-quinone oxidoreductase subunit S [Populus alba x Populus x berolinensis]KAJ6943651.1 NAD(P)H-quinone oxidoreductase subunit S [Populus alba x Populus x berolinensis]KAJ6943661.1 NAD(P)H-quinone oxidoreductase subunit S [Populus alba x Populus x berolinensis]